jgi:hypothetical protein
VDSFSAVEILFEFSKAIRHSLISLESLNIWMGSTPVRSPRWPNRYVEPIQTRRGTWLP